MNRKLYMDSGAVLLLGILFFTLTFKEITALLAAAGAHEAGHLSALFITGLPPKGVQFTLSGPVILYQQSDSKIKEICNALSGPAAGFLLSGIFNHIWPICAELSFLLSVINLMPVLPLDGGRAFRAVLPERFIFMMSILGFLIPVLIMMAGLACMAEHQSGSGLLLFGAWLLLLSCQEAQFDVK